MRYRSTTSLDFRQQLENLPETIQDQAFKQYDLFSQDPFHPSLRLKQIGSYWSVRISRSYRALAIRTGDSFVWIWIGNHDEYESILRKQ